MQKFCHHCGKQLTAGAKFCAGCGTNLSSLAATPASSSTFTPFVADSDEDGEGRNPIDEINYLTRLRSLRMEGLAVEIKKDQAASETVGQLGIAALSDAKANGGVLPVSQMPSRDTPYANVNKDAFLSEFRKDSAPAKRIKDES